MTTDRKDSETVSPAEAVATDIAVASRIFGEPYVEGDDAPDLDGWRSQSLDRPWSDWVDAYLVAWEATLRGVGVEDDEDEEDDADELELRASEAGESPFTAILSRRGR